MPMTKSDCNNGPIPATDVDEVGLAQTYNVLAVVTSYTEGLFVSFPGLPKYIQRHSWQASAAWLRRYVLVLGD